jgi:hypothetical protein
MPFYSNNKINKLIFLRHKLYLISLYLLKTALINLAKYNIVLLCFFIINKKVKIINKPYKVYS